MRKGMCMLILGLSPRGRGNQPRRIESPGSLRSIPAWAGQPHFTFGWDCTFAVYPRVGGATGLVLPFSLNQLGLSPRGRGNHSGLPTYPCWSRSIPAWAGQPPPSYPRPCLGRVYPRVGGATPIITNAKRVLSGLSPRGRGNRGCTHDSTRIQGSIPAWAGQPLAMHVRRRP